MADCQICFEAFSAQLRARVECPFCAVPVCKQCVSKYLLSVMDDPHCHACRMPWAPDFLDAHLTATFRTGKLRHHRENVLLDREKSMLPATQPFVEAVIGVERAKQEVAELQRQKRVLDRSILQAQLRLRDLQRVAASNGNGAEGGPPGFAASTVLRACVQDGCRGFLNSTSHRCGLCQTQVCPECLEIVKGDHTCDSNVLESVRQIRADSRPCPKCGSMIHRVSGCSQMYCTVPGCRTAFDWHTGRIVQGRIHNPHYYEYQRQQQQQQQRTVTMGREAGDIPCGGMPDPRVLSFALDAAGVVPEFAECLMSVLKLANRTTDVTLRFTYPPEDVETTFTTNKDLRIQFMLGKLTEPLFKRRLQMREKNRRKVFEVNQVLSMFCNVIADALRTLVIEKCSPPSLLTETISEICMLRTYVNECMHAVSKRFCCTVPFISIKAGLTGLDWELIHVPRSYFNSTGA